MVTWAFERGRKGFEWREKVFERGVMGKDRLMGLAHHWGKGNPMQ